VARALVDVRRATLAELDDVLELWAEGRDEITRLGRQSTSVEQVAPRLAEALAAGQIEILLARREGRPAGFLILRETPLTFMVDQPSICIDQLFVAVAARRRGVARAMLSLVAARAERSGAEQIVSSVTPWAKDTHRFFARLGFSPVTVRRSVSPATLRRRLTGEASRGGLEDVLGRRRSLRARARRRPELAIEGMDGTPDQDDLGEGNVQLA
jgi:predicted GNAT superfamily acetyltransferase